MIFSTLLERITKVPEATGLWGGGLVSGRIIGIQLGMRVTALVGGVLPALHGVEFLPIST